MSRNPEAIAQAIQRAQSVAVCSHINPDGDTIGSALAMRLALKDLGKRVEVFCEDKVPDIMMMLPGADQFRHPAECEESFDLFLAVDCSSPDRLGSGEQLMRRCAHNAQIDHHPTNLLYAETNSVEGDAPAACILIRDQLRTLGVPLNREIAMCLYTGISTDTGNFAFRATNAETFDIMGELMRAGLPLTDLCRVLFRERRREQVLLLGRALTHLQFRGDGRIAVMTLTRRDFTECGAMEEHADTLVNFGMETNGTDMAMMARETGTDEIKFSFRARAPYRVDELARRLGGGGHALASGASITGNLMEETERVLAEMTKELEAQTK